MIKIVYAEYRRRIQSMSYLSRCLSAKAQMSRVLLYRGWRGDIYGTDATSYRMDFKFWEHCMVFLDWPIATCGSSMDSSPDVFPRDTTWSSAVVCGERLAFLGDLDGPRRNYQAPRSP